MDTPRRARASISKGVDDDVALGAKLPETIGLHSAHLAPEDELRVITLLEQIADIPQKVVGVWLAVVEQADPRLPQSTEAPRRELAPLGLPYRRRIKDLDLLFHLCTSTPAFEKEVGFSAVVSFLLIGAIAI